MITNQLPDYDLEDIEAPIPRDVDPMLASQGFKDLLDEARAILDRKLPAARSKSPSSPAPSATTKRSIAPESGSYFANAARRVKCPRLPVSVSRRLPKLSAASSSFPENRREPPLN